jgi:predicted ATPase
MTQMPRMDRTDISTTRPYQEFGGWLRSRRLARRWTHQELARRLAYDVSYVRKIEWGERRPSDGFRVRLAQALEVPDTSLPPSAPNGSGTTIPAAPGALIGRAGEVAAVMDLFDRGSRLVTLLGPPGIGKTRLALELASRFHDLLSAGARFVPLASVAEPAGLARAIADSLGVPVPVAGEEVERLVSAVRAQDIVLVLDNFEHLVTAAPLVGDLLARAPALRVLVTSRQPLDLRIEVQFGLAPLALPEHVDQPADRLADVAAVALFVARAAKMRPDFVLDESNAATVAEICIRVDGIPLAIELAAGAAKFLALQEVLAQLGHGLDLPVPGPRDAPEHHRTLRAAIAWSFDLLVPDDQALMSRLGVFVGGCTLQAVDAVSRVGEDPTDLRPGLLGLAAKSLLQPTYLGPRTRFVMLEAVRAFALERLALGASSTCSVAGTRPGASPWPKRTSDG